MENLNKLFDEITQELTSEGQLFEVREYINKKGFKSKEYASFPDSLKGYFDFGALHGEKDFLVYESERFTFKETITKNRNKKQYFDGINAGRNVCSDK